MSLHGNDRKAEASWRPTWGRNAGEPTVLEDALHIEAIRGTRLVVSTSLQVIGQFAGSCIIDHSRVGRTDGICEDQRRTLN